MPWYLLNRSWSHPHSDDRVQSIRQRPVGLVSGSGRLWDRGEEGGGPWRQVGLQDPGQSAALEGHMKALAFRQLTVPSEALQHVVEDVDVFERTLWLLVSSPFLCWFGPGGSAGHHSQHKVRDSVIVNLLLSSIHRESCDDEEDVCSCPKKKEVAVPSSVIPIAEGRQRRNHDLVLVVFTAMDNAVTRAGHHPRMTQDVLEGDPVLGSDAQAGTDKVLYLIKTESLRYLSSALQISLSFSKGMSPWTLSKRRMPRDQKVAGPAW
jgi:hypothetical protein